MARAAAAIAALLGVFALLNVLANNAVWAEATGVTVQLVGENTTHYTAHVHCGSAAVLATLQVQARRTGHAWALRLLSIDSRTTWQMPADCTGDAVLTALDPIAAVAQLALRRQPGTAQPSIGVADIIVDSDGNTHAAQTEATSAETASPPAQPPPAVSDDVTPASMSLSFKLPPGAVAEDYMYVLQDGAIVVAHRRAKFELSNLEVQPDQVATLLHANTAADGATEAVFHLNAPQP